MDQRTQYLLTAPALPLLTQLSVPSSVAFIVQSTVSLTEVWYVGQLGSTPLAAMALVFPMLMLMQMLSVGALGTPCRQLLRVPWVRVIKHARRS